jgi:hypothetical protein
MGLGHECLSEQQPLTLSATELTQAPFGQGASINRIEGIAYTLGSGFARLGTQRKTQSVTVYP